MASKRTRPLLVTLVAAAVAAVLVGGWLLYGALFGPKVYEADDTAIEVSAGETFSVRLEENRSTGYRWRFEEPGPDERVVTRVGSGFETDEPVLDGSGGELTLDFRAKAAGRTTLKLLYCRQCGMPGENTGSPEATTVTFDVTVQD
ncbi:protease inhibitor I42 family protein [Streptomyces sp. NPDC054796]